MLYNLLYYEQAPWKIGEHEDDRKLRLARGDAVDFADLYPGSYAGWITSVIPATRDFSPGELAHPCRAVLELDLTAEELSSVRRRECCVVAGALEPVTFDQRQGAIASGLRAAFQDPEDLEAHEDERIHEVMDENMRREQVYMAAFAVWRESLKLLVEGGEIGEAQPLPQPKPLVLLDTPEPIFALKVRGLSRALLQTIVHSGAGLYKVDGSGSTHNDTIVSAVKDNGTTTITLTTGLVRDFAGEVFVSGGNGYAIKTKTDDTHLVVIGDASGESGACTISPYTTVQSALDQLWTDQGAATFTEIQYIRIFAGTYDETVTPNSSLNPDVPKGYLLIIEGDPTAARTDVVVAPSSGRAFYCVTVETVIRHLKATASVYQHGGGIADDLQIISSTIGLQIASQILITDSDIAATNEAIKCDFSGGSTFDIRRCQLAGAYGLRHDRQQSGRIEACVIDASAEALRLVSSIQDRCFLLLTQNTLYSAGLGLRLDGHVDAVLTNNIFEDCTDNFRILQTGGWPEENATRLGPSVVMRNNCFHGYTNFANDLTNIKTYAEFIAFNRVDAAGDLDDTDPLMTDPGSGDFSLQTGSPCRHRGVGSGVAYDVNGDPFDPYHPDIGAVSTGIGPNVAYSG